MGDTITAKVEVMEVNPDKNRVRFKTICPTKRGRSYWTSRLGHAAQKRVTMAADDLSPQTKSFRRGMPFDLEIIFRLV